MGKGVRVGLDKLYYAIMTDEVNETYDTPVRIPGVISATVSPEVNSETLYADDKADEVATALGNITIEVNTKDIPTEDHAALLGSSIDANGVLRQASTDNAPYVAIGFRSRKSNGKYRYFWYYKGKFNPSDEEYATKEASPTFQTPTITGTFLPRDKDNEWRARVDEDDTGVPATVITNWFSAVYEETPDTTPPTVSSVVPADAATAVTAGANIVWTFSEAVRPSTVNTANFQLLKTSDFSPVAGTVSLDVTGKIVTFNPSANLTAATEHVAIASTGVKDLAGNALAAASATTFTTA